MEQYSWNKFNDKLWWSIPWDFGQEFAQNSPILHVRVIPVLLATPPKCCWTFRTCLLPFLSWIFQNGLVVQSFGLGFILIFQWSNPSDRVGSGAKGCVSRLWPPQWPRCRRPVAAGKVVAMFGYQKVSFHFLLVKISISLCHLPPGTFSSGACPLRAARCAGCRRLWENCWGRQRTKLKIQTSPKGPSDQSTPQKDRKVGHLEICLANIIYR